MTYRQYHSWAKTTYARCCCINSLQFQVACENPVFPHVYRPCPQLLPSLQIRLVSEVVEGNAVEDNLEEQLSKCRPIQRSAAGISAGGAANATARASATSLVQERSVDSGKSDNTVGGLTRRREGDGGHTTTSETWLPPGASKATSRKR